jgi:hypothetical protein
MPPRVWALIEACLHRDPQQRPAAATLRTTLRRLAAETAGIPALLPVPKGEFSRRTFLLAGTDPAQSGRGAANPRRVKTRTPAPRPRESRWRRVTPALAAVVVALLAAGGFAGYRLTADRRTAAPPSQAPGPRGDGALPAAAGPAGTTPAPSAGPARPSGNAGGGSAAPVAESAPTSAVPSNPARPPAGPIGEAPEDYYGDWRCTEERWPVGHPVVAEACYAVGSAIKYQGIFKGISGVKANLEVSLVTEGGTRVAGPVACLNRTFTDQVQQYTCGPRVANLPPGRYKVVAKWVYPSTDSVTPPGSVEGDPFDF